MPVRLQAHPTMRPCLAIVFAAILAAACGGRPPSTDAIVLEPTVRPTQGPEAPTGSAPANIALGRPVDASALLPGEPAAGAVDGDPETIWNSGGDPVQWIEIDLGATFSIDRLVLMVAQSPAGVTTHRVTGRGDAGQDQLLHEFRGANGRR